MGEIDKVAENALRRQAKRLGLKLKKSSGKKFSIDNQLEYMIIDAEMNVVLAGPRYDLSFEEAKEWIDDYEKRLIAETEVAKRDE